jgi:hypothetical protein
MIICSLFDESGKLSGRNKARSIPLARNNRIAIFQGCFHNSLILQVLCLSFETLHFRTDANPNRILHDLSMNEQVTRMETAKNDVKAKIVKQVQHELGKVMIREEEHASAWISRL